MPLYDLLNDFRKDENALKKWMFAHQQQHKLIIKALQKRGITAITEYIIFPFPKNDQRRWLLANQQMHNEANSFLSLDGTDMQEVDLKDEGGFKSWLESHWREHYSINQALSI